MHRFYIPAEHWNLDALRLQGGEMHHCLDVLRLKKGDRIAVFNGRGVEATVEISGIAGESVELRALHHSKSPLLPAAITLGQAIPKGKNMDLIVEKATELGATAIAPLLSERTVVQCDSAEAERKQAKWRTVAIEAAKQCGQNWLPTVGRPQSLKTFFAQRSEYDLMLIASLQPDARHLKKVLGEAADHGTPMTRVLVLIGPEGDFTPAEVSLAKSNGCQSITLGPIILRTETAAIYVLSVLSHELLQDE